MQNFHVGCVGWDAWDGGETKHRAVKIRSSPRLKKHRARVREDGADDDSDADDDDDDERPVSGKSARRQL